LETPNGTHRPNEITTESSPEQQAASPKGWLRRNGIYLVLALAFAGLLRYWGVTWEGFQTGLIVALGLGLVIFIHELGHFLVAKWCDVHVEVFSIGFGPPLPGCCYKWGETTYMIALLPLGGYVKMVGEGAENDESDTDPRSFKNKTVWQRMAIISAGVTMNLILAFACFVFVFKTHGDEQAPGVVGLVEDGSPAWKAGARSGDVIHRIGNSGLDPDFEVLRKEVMNSGDEPLDLELGPPGGKSRHVRVKPRLEDGDLYPVIGLGPPSQLQVWTEKLRKIHQLPVVNTSAARQAEPPFEFGDSVVATTDPDHPDQIKELPPDPRNPSHRDYFEFESRLRRLAGQPMTVRVQRHKGKDTVDIRVPPAYHYVLGARMRMGKIIAVRDDSPAMTAGVQPEDILVGVEVGVGKDRVLFTNDPTQAKGKDVMVRKLDPVRLPFELEQWAAQQPGSRELKVIVMRKNPPPILPEKNFHTLTLAWDDSWKDNHEAPGQWVWSQSIPGLGLAYRVETTVEEVEPGSPAELAGLRPDDVIKAFRLEVEGATPDEFKPDKWEDLKSDQWALFFLILQITDSKTVSLRVDRDKTEMTMTAREDTGWPQFDRGVRFIPDERLHKAETLGEALSMGVNKTVFFVSQIFGNLRGVSTGRLSYKNFGGPITIARVAFFAAGDNIYRFLVFLGIIGVNLAVVNFLPIPVLDGGHMVFLIYEKLRGKPAPEPVRVALTLVGVALILSLMVFVTFLDVSRLKFW
jgi:regulator of sigma E protease